MEIEISETKKVAVKYLKVEAEVRYWDDAEINGQSDDNGDAIPLRKGGCWCPVIDLESGVIEGWPQGLKADIHYKVCDSGVYTLLDADRKEVVKIDGYVPKIMSPGGEGYGDYIIMEVNGAGEIANWRADLDAFAEQS